MLYRLATLLLALVAAAFGQSDGIIGPFSAHLKACDFAPEIMYTRVLSAGTSTPWNASNLFGQFTVLAFFPNTSHNEQAVSQWNEVAGQFAGKSIQFAWITAEKESSLVPWLQEHPIKGWVFDDSEGATARAYGIEFPVSVIIGPDRRILAFDSSWVPEAATLEAVLRGRITTVRPKPTPAALKEFSESGLVLLDAEPPRMPSPDEHRPRFAPSFEVHISPSQSDVEDNSGGTDFWSLQRYSVKDLFAELLGMTPTRVRLPTSLDNDSAYDVAIVLPRPEDKDSLYGRLLKGVQDYFGVTAARGERLMDVYVVSQADGKPPVAKGVRNNDDFADGGVSSSSIEFQALDVPPNSDDLARLMKPGSIDKIRGIYLEGTMDVFCSTLEHTLDRPVVNETNLSGVFAVDVKATEGSDNDFLDHLRDKMNLRITPAQRRVQIVAVNPR